MDGGKKKKGISVVLPLFNEEGNLDALCGELTKTLDAAAGEDYEIIFVDDGSADNGVSILLEWKKRNPRIKIIRFSRNFGQHPAIMAGLRHSTGEKVVTLDADLQNSPSDIPMLLEELDRGCDIASGWREIREDSALRRITSRIVNKIFSSLSGVELRDYGSMLRAYNRKAVERIIGIGSLTIPINAVASWSGLRIAEVRVAHRARGSGKSKYGLLKLLRVNFDTITGLSLVPIQIISLLGILISSVGFLTGGYLIFLRILHGVDVWGLRSLFAMITIFFGVTLLSIGIIGEYIARIYLEVRRIPDFIIQEVID